MQKKISNETSTFDEPIKKEKVNTAIQIVVCIFAFNVSTLLNKTIIWLLLENNYHD